MDTDRILGRPSILTGLNCITVFVAKKRFNGALLKIKVRTIGQTTNERFAFAASVGGGSLGTHSYT